MIGLISSGFVTKDTSVFIKIILHAYIKGIRASDMYKIEKMGKVGIGFTKQESDDRFLKFFEVLYKNLSSEKYSKYSK